MLEDIFGVSMARKLRVLGASHPFPNDANTISSACSAPLLSLLGLLSN